MDASRARGCKETARAARGIAVWPLKMKRYITLAQKPGMEAWFVFHRQVFGNMQYAIAQIFSSQICSVKTKTNSLEDTGK